MQRQLDKYPYFMRTSWTGSLPHHPLGQWACDNGFKKVIVIAADYAFGYETRRRSFQSPFRSLWRQGHSENLAARSSPKDFGPYIPTFKADADGIFTTMVGPMALQFPSRLRCASRAR